LAEDRGRAEQRQKRAERERPPALFLADGVIDDGLRQHRPLLADQVAHLLDELHVYLAVGEERAGDTDDDEQQRRHRQQRVIGEARGEGQGVVLVHSPNRSQNSAPAVSACRRRARACHPGELARALQKQRHA
jgi:hypothetical protein